MNRIARTLVSSLAVLVLASGCGSKHSGGSAILGPGNGTTGGGGVGPGPMSMNLDGAAWTSYPSGGAGGITETQPGLFVLVALSSNLASGSSVTISLYNISGPGTYPLGVNITNRGGWMTYADANSAWWTPLTGSAGSVTITTLSSTRIAGTFTAILDSLSGAAHGHRTVTSGTFDFPILARAADPVPEWAGNSISMKRDGVAWNVATVIGLMAPTSGGSMLSVGGGSDDAMFGLVATGVAGAAVHPFESAGTGVRLSDAAGTMYWGGGTITGPGGTSLPADSGAVTITSLTTTRVKGTFGGKLAPTLGSGPALHLTEGSFDIGIPPPSVAAGLRAIGVSDARRMAMSSVITARATMASRN